MSGVITDRALEIRQRLTDARALCTELGLVIMARGATPRQVLACCPWHPDRTPSCSVRLAPDGTIAVKCQSCGHTADALGLIAQVRGLDDFQEVLRVAADLANAPALAEPIEAVRTPRKVESVSDETYHAIWSTALEACSPMRSVAPRSTRYLFERGVYADAEAAGVRGLPRDPRELVASLRTVFERLDLELAGVLREGFDAIDWPHHELLIPWMDRFGRIQCVQRRRLDNGKPKYLTPRGRSPKAPYGIDLLGDALAYQGPVAEIVICEGALDTLARRRIDRESGAKSAVIGVYSASSPMVGLPVDLLNGRIVVLALDDDAAGDRASDAIAHELRDVASRIVRSRPVGAKDWGEALTGIAS